MIRSFSKGAASLRRTWTIDRIARRFFRFAASIGYRDTYEIRDTSFTELYAKGNHAISVSIDWRDYYLDMFVLRMTDGELPTPGARLQDGRLCCIPLRDIYQMEPPAYPGENDRSAEALLHRLDWLIAMVEKDPGVLKDYIDHIDAHTSVEATQRYLQRAFERRLTLLEEEYALGKMDEKTYSVLRRSLQAQLDALDKK